MNPVKDSGIRFAPAENSIKGIAVIAPENNNQNDDMFIPKLSWCCCHK